MYALKVRNIRYNVDFQQFSLQQIYNKSATGVQHFRKLALGKWD
jgi:hypothetical protein